MAFDKYDDVIDSRDVIARIEELEALIDDEDSPLDEADKDELVVLKLLAEEGESSPDWKHGETLIRDSYFTEYAQELAEDIGAINPNASWPNDCIDWERAARELRYDYTSVNFDNVIYWIRS